MLFRSVSQSRYVGWDGVGDGMTGSTGGEVFSDLIIGQGMSPLIIEGSVIGGRDNSFSVYAYPEEAGDFSMKMVAYELDPTVDVE